MAESLDMKKDNANFVADNQLLEPTDMASPKKNDYTFLWTENIKSSPSYAKPCTWDDFTTLLDSEEIEQHCYDAEDFAAQGMEDALRKEKEQLPALLIGVRGLRGDGTRKNENAIPSGKYVLDIDHLETSPWDADEIYDTFIDGREDELDIFWVFKSPSGRGIKVAYNLQSDETPAEGNVRIANALFQREPELLEKPYFDQSSKDFVRCTYMVTAENTLWADWNRMFTPVKYVLPQKYFKPTTAKARNEPTPISGNVIKKVEDTELPLYRGTMSYVDIVDRWFKAKCGGYYPKFGDRHDMICLLMRHLRNITGDNAILMSKAVWECIKDKPEFKGKTLEEVIGCAKWAQSTDYLYGATKDIKDVVASLENENEESEEDYVETTPLSEFAQRMEDILPQMPLSVQYTLKNTWPEFRIPILFTVWPLLGALGSHVSFHPIKNRAKLHYLGLQSIILGITGIGKSQFDDALKLWKAPFEEEEKRMREVEDEWKNNEQIRANSERGAKRPQEPRRFLDATVSEATLGWRLKIAEKADICCFQFSTELDSLTKNCAANSQLWTTYRKAFDREEDGRERVSKEGISGHWHARLNWSFTGVPNMAASMLTKSMLTSGTVNRIAWAVVPDDLIWESQPDIEAWSDEEKTEIANAATYMSQREGFIRLPLLDDDVYQWGEEVKENALKDGDMPMVQNSHRIKAIMQRFGIILHLLFEHETGSSEMEPVVLKFARLVGDYCLHTILALTSDAEAAQASFSVYKPKGGGRNQLLLDMLPRQFSTTDMHRKLLELGRELDSKREIQIRKDWSKNGYAHYNKDTGLWEKGDKQIKREESKQQ